MIMIIIGMIRTVPISNSTVECRVTALTQEGMYQQIITQNSGWQQIDRETASVCCVDIPGCNTLNNVPNQITRYRSP
jgi:hypothetical protein